jgi:hypothetical protein
LDRLVKSQDQRWDEVLCVRAKMRGMSTLVAEGGRIASRSSMVMVGRTRTFFDRVEDLKRAACGKEDPDHQ